MSKFKDFFDNDKDKKYDYSKLNPLDQVCMAVALYNYAKKMGDCPSHLVFYNSNAYWNVNGKNEIKLNGEGKRLLNFYKTNYEKTQHAFKPYKEIYDIILEEAKNCNYKTQEEQFLYYAKNDYSRAIAWGELEMKGKDVKVSPTGRVTLVNSKSKAIYSKLIMKMQKETSKEKEI